MRKAGKSGCGLLLCVGEVFCFGVLLGGSEVNGMRFAVQGVSIAIFPLILQDTSLDINYTSDLAITREAGRQVALLSSTADSSPAPAGSCIASPQRSHALPSSFGLCCRDRSLGHRPCTTAGPISSHPTAFALPFTSPPTRSAATATVSHLRPWFHCRSACPSGLARRNLRRR